MVTCWHERRDIIRLNSVKYDYYSITCLSILHTGEEAEDGVYKLLGLPFGAGLIPRKRHDPTPCSNTSSLDMKLGAQYVKLVGQAEWLKVFHIWIV